MTTHTNAAAERIDGPDSELLDVGTVAKLLDCSRRHVYRLSDAGRMPRPLKLGALVRWRRVELMSWLADGCPAVRMGKGAAR